MTRCLITGATGFVGSHLVEALLARGYHVDCLVRKTSNLDWLKGLTVRLVYGDVVEAASLPAAVAEADYVYHVAGVVKSLDEATYYIVNAGGTSNLLEACATTAQARAHAYQRIVVVTSQAAAGPPPPGQLMTETGPTAPITPYGHSKLRAEAIAAGYFDRLPITIVRPPAIYGPRDRETLAAYQWISRGICPLPAWEQRFSVLHVRDLTRGLIVAAEHPASVGRIYHLANDQPESLESIGRLIATALGKHPIVVRLPRVAFAIAGQLSELAATLQRKPQIFDHYKTLEIAQPSFVSDTSRARQELGYRAEIPIATGIAETADWYRQAGWL